VKIAVNDSQKFGALLEGMERIAYLVSRYAIFEDLYLHHQLSSFDGLERSLIELYATVLMYLSKARCYYDQSTACTLKNESSIRVVIYLLSQMSQCAQLRVSCN
jgi:hypothetical protein